MLKHWRGWVLGVLFFGPVLAYMGFGAYWLWQRGWVLYAFAAWVTAGIAFAILGNRWTKAKRELLPPIDWDVPETFGAHDRLAWDLVQQESNLGDSISMESLSGVDIYIETGRRLATRLAAHYHPLSTNPIEHVPIVEILTSLELAAEDLTRLCRQIPGGDLVTYAHWKKAVVASGYLQRANEIYGYLLPIFQPLTGLVRLGTQKLMVQPAWKNMQQNVLRWFFRAFVNRLGTHLIELYSGRLAIGTDGYRKLRRTMHGKHSSIDEAGPLIIAVAGARDAGKSALITALDEAIDRDLSRVKAILDQGGFDEDLADRLRHAEWLEVPGYTVSEMGESARDRSTRRDAVEDAVDADMLLLVIDAKRGACDADIAFVKAWQQRYADQKSISPPALAIVTNADRLEVAGVGGSLTNGPSSTRREGLRALLDGLRKQLPASITEILSVNLASEHPTGISDGALPALAPLLHRADRASAIRHLRKLSTRSRARRLLSQVGRQGKSLWQSMRRGKRTVS
jgi:uncharacterized protein